MKKVIWIVAIVWHLALPTTAPAQDYRARLQGSIADESRGALPGATVTLRNDGTGVTVTRTTNGEGRYVFDFVDPGKYTVLAELQGFRTIEQKNVVVQQRGDVTVDLTMAVGGLEERVVVEASPVAVQFNSSSQDLTLQRELIDQVPLNGRNPYNLANLDPTMFNTPGTTEHENRPYHHAFANDLDAGGGTRRANDVLLDGVPLAASFKTAYTPSIDAVEEITISKNSVDAEFGHSLGGVISLNMKAGTNQFHGSSYVFGRDPKFNSVADPTVRRVAGADDDWRDDRWAAAEEPHLLLHIDRAVGRQQAADDRAHAANRPRAAGGLQSVGSQRPRPQHLRSVHVENRPGHWPCRANAVQRQRDSGWSDRSGCGESVAGVALAEPARQH
jgi:hypothetical protein